LCTRYEVKDGRFTGDFIEPLCYGEGKVIHAERFAREHNIDVDASYFYTDSCTDLPMLERVSYPRVVNPDVRLRWVAKRKGWPILNWS
jgi:putative phosphoserine phosphatase/1-acylglycerol-3-phosphate O-acyltransferase